MGCLIGLHTWWIQKHEVDPMTAPSVTFSNYINIFYHCECVECGNTKVVKKVRLIPEGTQQLANRKVGLL